MRGLKRLLASRFAIIIGGALLGGALLAGCDDEPSSEVKTVEVVYNDGAPVVVDLADLEVVTLDDGEEYARLSDVVEAANLGVALSALEFDFEGADGFRSSNQDNCAEIIPMSGDLLSQGYINRTTRNLAWDEALGFPGCTRVDDTARLLATDAAAAGSTVDVVYSGETTTVDLAVVDAAGTGTVTLPEVIAAADLGATVETLAFDFVASDGFRVSEASNCAEDFPIAGDQLGAGSIEVATRNLTWDEAAGLPGCASVDGLATIEVSDLSTGPTVTVVYGATSVTVDLAEAEGETAGVAPLADVIALADLGVAVESLAFDFVASDGFRVSEATNCASTFPIGGDQLAAGSIEIATRNLSWDEAAALPGCANVDDLATIEVTDLSTGPFVDVVHGETTVTVDLSQAEVVDFEGSNAVRLTDVVDLAALGVATADLTFDFVASDGFRVSEATNCASTFPIGGDQLGTGYIELATRNLVWDATAGMPGCAFADDLATIEAFDP